MKEDKQLKTSWYKRKDGTHVYKSGRYKVLELTRRPHGAWCCIIFNKGILIAREGYHGTSLSFKYLAVRWGMDKARELKII